MEINQVALQRERDEKEGEGEREREREREREGGREREIEREMRKRGEGGGERTCYLQPILLQKNLPQSVACPAGKSAAHCVCACHVEK